MSDGIAKVQDVDRLIEVLKSRNPESVIAAARALGTLGNRMAVEPLVILFHNSSSPPAVRLSAAEALLELKSAPAVVTLLGALRRDSWEVRRNAAAVLGQIQAVWAVAPLAAALDDPHPVVRRTAAAALKRIGTAEAIAALRARFAPPTLPEVATPPKITEKTASPARQTQATSPRGKRSEWTGYPARRISNKHRQRGYAPGHRDAASLETTAARTHDRTAHRTPASRAAHDQTAATRPS